MLRFFAIRFARALITIVLVVTFAFIVLRLSGDPAPDHSWAGSAAGGGRGIPQGLGSR
jgi:ABC-type dipeptide/oligopeptide/nickel transport system permease component